MKNISPFHSDNEKNYDDTINQKGLVKSKERLKTSPLNLNVFSPPTNISQSSTKYPQSISKLSNLSNDSILTEVTEHMTTIVKSELNEFSTNFKNELLHSIRDIFKEKFHNV